MPLLRRTLLLARTFRRYLSIASPSTPRPTSPPTTDPTPLQTWFSQFPGYSFDKSLPPYHQFAALKQQQNWDDATERIKHRHFLRAFKRQHFSPVDLYFLNFSGHSRFPYDPADSPVSQWRKLKEMKGWPADERGLEKVEELKPRGEAANEGSEEGRREAQKEINWRKKKLKDFRSARHKFRVAVGEEVEAGGVGEEKGRRWVNMCKIFEVEPPSEDAGDCIEALLEKPVMVNIFDYLASQRELERTGRAVKPVTFETETALAEYSESQSLVFPKKLVKGEIIHFLRKYLFRKPPSPEDEDVGSEDGKIRDRRD